MNIKCIFQGRANNRIITEFKCNFDALWQVPCYDITNTELIQYTIDQKGDTWNQHICDRYMYTAAENGHMHMILFFIDKGAKDWNGCMQSAAKSGNLDIVQFFMDKDKDEDD
jgi:hypothetical protein